MGKGDRLRKQQVPKHSIIERGFEGTVDSSKYTTLDIQKLSHLIPTASDAASMSLHLHSSMGTYAGLSMSAQASMPNSCRESNGKRGGRIHINQRLCCLSSLWFSLQSLPHDRQKHHTSSLKGGVYVTVYSIEKKTRQRPKVPTNDEGVWGWGEEKQANMGINLQVCLGSRELIAC